MARSSKSIRPPETAITANPMAFRPVVEVNDGVPVFYANHVEVNSNQVEFGLTFARVPTRFTADQNSEIAETGQFLVSAEAHIIVAPKVLLGMISALQEQMQAQASLQEGLAKAENGNDQIRKRT